MTQSFRIASAFVALLLAACASQQMGGGRRMMGAGAAAPAPQVGEAEIRYGRIAQIDPVSLDGDHQLGMGHVMGAVAGGMLGHQFGNGNGRMVAQVLGSLGGGYLGGQIQNKYVDKRPGQHITVTLNNGVAVGITQPADPALRVGDCVRVDGAGQNAHVVRAECVGTPVFAEQRPPASPGAAPGSLRQRLMQERAERAAGAGVGAGAGAGAGVGAGVGAGANARPMGENEIRFGTIEHIEPVALSDAHQLGFTGAMNGTSGRAMGYLLPAGGGREFADVANQYGHDDGRAPPALPAGQGQLVTVKLDNGIAVAIAQPTDSELRVGDRVRIVGTGPSARVSRA